MLPRKLRCIYYVQRPGRSFARDVGTASVKFIERIPVCQIMPVPSSSGVKILQIHFLVDYLICYFKGLKQQLISSVGELGLIKSSERESPTPKRKKLEVSMGQEA